MTMARQKIARQKTQKAALPKVCAGRCRQGLLNMLGKRHPPSTFFGEMTVARATTFLQLTARSMRGWTTSPFRNLVVLWRAVLYTANTYLPTFVRVRNGYWGATQGSVVAVRCNMYVVSRSGPKKNTLKLCRGKGGNIHTHIYMYVYIYI